VTPHELFDILDTVPHWQTRFASLREAAEYAKALPEYYDYTMNTAEGRLRQMRYDTVPDINAQNRAERIMRERMAVRPSRADPEVTDLLDTPEHEIDFIRRPDAVDGHKINPEEVDTE
jgi:hypothetical protein